MRRRFLIKLVLLAIACPLGVQANQRIQTELPIYDLRQMITRYSPGASGRATIGQIRNGQYFPVQTYSVGALGTTDCAALLDRAQAFPLEGMLNRKYIDQETFDALKHSRDYLHTDQATFFSVLSYLSSEEFAKNRSIISDTQLGIAPPRSNQDPTSVAVAVGSAFLVAGYRHINGGIETAALPWEKDEIFSKVAPAILKEKGGVNFEMGRAMQVIQGTLDHNINAVLMTIAHEMAITKADFSTARVFVHSYKRANTIAYQRKFPTLKVVATDPNNAENIILATSLDKLFSPEKPWGYSGPIQSILSANPKVLTIPKVWGFLTALRTSGALSFDYHDSQGKRGLFPVAMRLPSLAFSALVSGHTSKMGITRQEEADLIVKALNESNLLANDGSTSNLSDPASLRAAPIFEFSGNVVTLSSLDPKESLADPNYELRILISGVLQYSEILRWADRTGIETTRYALITTNPSVAKKIESLGPTDQRSDSQQLDWYLKDDPKGATMNFEQTTARSFIFSFADVERLAKAHPVLFKEMQERPALRIGQFHKRNLLSRPTGL
jgi:hypothetical protein